MPKIIENLRETLLTEAKRQLDETGYSALTIRSVAKSCGIAVGTVYNYFPSKEYLVGCVVLRDWEAFRRRMEQQVEEAPGVDAGLEAVYQALLEFVALYQGLFTSNLGTLNTAYAQSERHDVLLGQLVALLHQLFARFPVDADEFTGVFLAESMLKCCTKPYPYSQLRPIFLKLISKKG